HLDDAFFFSSRRRHTRFSRDWSSDVCSSDLPIQVRMLDNVIDLNRLPVPQATITNRKYRAIGLGTFGWHHLLAQKGIHWETPEEIGRASCRERVSTAGGGVP